MSVISASGLSFGFRRAFLAIGGALLLALLCGCASIHGDAAQIGPFFVPRNVQADPTLGGIRRVVLMPVWAGNSAPEETAVSLDPILRQALIDQNRFEVVVMDRQECQRRFGVMAIGSTAALPHNFISTVQRVYAADAIMFVDVTVYRAYHPLALGLRGRLAIVNNSRLVWAFDNLFSADDATVAASARNFFLKSPHQGVPGDLTPAVLQSPSRFATYAAHATFSTLPPVTLGKFTETSAGKH